MAVIRTSALTQQAEEQLGHPVDLVSCFAARQEWYVRRTDRNMLTADVPGHWSHYHLQVTWQDYDETLRLIVGSNYLLMMGHSSGWRWSYAC